MIKIIRRHVILFLIVLLLLGALFGIFIYRWYSLQTVNVPIEAEITSNMIGFNTGTDRLYFGSVAPGGSGERLTHVVCATRCRVVVSVDGVVAPWIVVSQNKFVLDEGVRGDVLFRMYVPESAALGNVSGTAIIRYYRALPWE